MRTIIIVTAFCSFPVFKSLASFRWDISGPSMSVKMPFTNISCFIPGPGEYFGNTQFRIRKVGIVKKHSGRGWIPAGHQRCAIRSTNRANGYSISKIKAFFFKTIKIRCPDIWISGVTCSRSTPLVGQDINNIRFIIIIF